MSGEIIDLRNYLTPRTEKGCVAMRMLLIRIILYMDDEHVEGLAHLVERYWTLKQKRPK